MRSHMFRFRATIVVVLLTVGPVSVRADLQNAAFRTSASATNQLNTSWTPAHAVDEVTGNNGWHSLSGTVDPWWQVDMGGLIPVQSVTVRARRDGGGVYEERINDCAVTLYESADATGVPVYSNVVKIFSIDANHDWHTFVLPDITLARSVRISDIGSTRVVNLAEAYVHAENLARGCPAQQSTDYNGTFIASRATDGIHTGNNPDFTHTQNESAPWWRVDLERVVNIGVVKLVNRNDSNPERLADLNVQVFAADGTTVVYDYKVEHGDTLLNPGNAMGSPPVILLDLHGEGTQGQHIKVTRELPSGTGPLSLAEVEVYGQTLAENRKASSIGATVATANGYISGTNTNTTVKLYWGAEDKGTAWGQWANTNTIGVTATGTGDVSVALSGLTADTSYFYRFHASNTIAEGAAEYSHHLRTIAVSDGLMLWLTAGTITGLVDGASVAGWDDASQGGYELVQSSGTAQPTYYTNVFGGQPVVSFDGGDNLWAGHLQRGWPSNNLTVFFVTKADATTGNEFYRANPNDGADRFLTHYAYSNGNTYFDFGNISANGRLQWPNNNVTALNLVCYWQDSSVGQRAFRNGIRLNSDNNTSAFSVNGYKFLLGNGYQGDLGEILVYNRALTADECSTVGLYLAQKYGIETPYYDPDSAVPPSIAGLSLWLDAENNPLGYADGAGAAAWPDRSGQANDAVQGSATLQPLFTTNVLSGKPVMRFDGTDDYLDGPGLNLTAQTIMMVLKLDADVAASLPGAFARKGADAWNIRGTSTDWNYTGITANTGDFAYNGTVMVNGVARPAHGNQYHILTQIATGVGANQYRLSQTAYTRYWKGDMAEVLAYDRALTVNEQGQLGHYLEQKYGLTSEYGMVDNVPGASAITASGATLNGNLCGTDAGQTTVVQVCWGEADGGAAFGAWEYTNTVVTTTTPQGLAHPVTGLMGARTYFYRYYASNGVSGGAWADSAEVFKTDFQTAPSGISLWLAADAIQGLSGGEGVERWPDLSGSGKDAVQPAVASQPQYVTGVLGGKPAVRNASGKTLLLSDSLDPMGKTMVIVHEQDAGQTSWTLVMGGDLHTTTSGGMFSLTRSGGQFQINSSVSSKQFAANFLQMVNGDYAFWIDGSSIGTSANTANPLVSFTHVGNNFFGDIAEIIVFDGTLDATARAEVGNYLEDRYALDTPYVRVDNSGGATAVDQSVATVNGHVYYTDGGESTVVKVLWGTSDGGAATGTWEHTNTVATITSPQDVSLGLTGLDPATVYYYRMVASNAVSGSAFAEDAAIFETRFSSVNSGLVLWLDSDSLRGTADGAAVSYWQDLSGNGNHASQGNGTLQPLFYTNAVGGKSVLRFDGSNDYMDGPNANLQAQTIFMVLKMQTSPPNLSGVFARKGYDQQNIRTGTTTRWNAPEWQANSGDFCQNGAVYVNGSSTSYHNNQYHILEEVSDDAPVFQYRLSQPLVLGGNHRNFKGDLSEVIIYNRTLSTEERREVGRYLMGKYGIAGAYGKYDLPEGAADPLIWYDLDSQTGLSDGDTIGTLYDFSGNNYNGASKATANFPTFETNAPGVFGGKPVVRFGGQDDCWFEFGLRSDIRTVFWVVQEDPAATGIRFLLGRSATSYHFHRGQDANRYIWGGSAAGNVKNGRTLVDGLHVDGQFTPMPTTPSIVALRTTGNVEANSLSCDRNITGRRWFGDVAELLVYNRALSDSEMARVGAYLDDKYGLSTGYGFVDNADGATNITDTAAFLDGNWNATDGGASTVVRVFWGQFDGGPIEGAWDNTNTLATVTSPQTFSYGASGLKPSHTYYYRFYASNAVSGAVWTDNASAFTTDFQGPTAGVSLWLAADSITGKSDGEAMSEWSDLSGNSKHAVQLAAASQPLYSGSAFNGNPAVQFDGTDDFMDGPYQNVTVQTLFFVLRLDATAPDVSGVFCQKNADSRNVRNSGTSADWIWPVTANSGDFCYNGGAVNVNGENAPTHGNQDHILLEVAASPQTLQYRLSQSLVLNGNARNFKGDLAELIAFDGTLSDAEKAEVGAHLEAKYGLDTAYGRVDNTGGATNIGSTTATLNGRVNYTDGGESTVVKVFYGESDGGAAFGGWDQTGTVTTVSSPQAVLEAVGGLKGGRTYYYRYYVSNSVSGSVWAESSALFKTDFQLPSCDTVFWLAADTIRGVSDGQNVVSWPDVSGYGKDASQATVGSQPQYATAVAGGEPAVSFGGSHVLSTSGLSPAWPTNLCTMIVVQKNDNTSHNNNSIAASPNDNANRFLIHLPHAGTAYWDFGNISAGGRLSYGFDGGTDWNVMVYERSATGMRILRNGVQKASKSGGGTFTPGTKSLTIGGALQGDMAEVIVFDGTLDAAAEAEVGIYLEDKYGISMPYVRVDNSGGATAVDRTVATVNGHVYYTDGGESTVVKVLWGTSDGGAALGAWEYTNTVTTVTSAQDVSLELTGLNPAAIYHYRMAVSNSVSGNVVAESAEMFETRFSSVNSGLVLWLDSDFLAGTADGTPVSHWQDLSGNNNHASQGNGTLQPLYYTNSVGGKPVLRFDGSNDYMDGPAANLKAQTIFMILKMEATAPGLSGVFAQKGADNQNIRNANATSWRAPSSGANSADFSFGGAVYVNGSGTWVHNNEYHILEEVSDDAPSFQYRISQTQYSRYFKGDLAEVIVYNRTLTKDERREVGRYLMGKYGMSAAYGKYDLPEGTEDPAIWYDLDSHVNMSDGQSIGTLFDFSGNNRNGTSQATANFPTYTTNGPAAFGGKPIVRFNGANDNWFSFARVSGMRTVFWVISEDPAANKDGFLLGDASEYNFHRGTGDGSIWYNNSHVANVYNGVTRLNGDQIEGLITPMPETATLLSLVTTGGVQANQLSRDRSIDGRNWHGDLAELIVYTRALSDFEVSKVGYYLEQKYGLTTDFGMVDNANGATNVTQTTAYLCGNLNGTDGGESTVVKVFWGATDEGMTAGGWDHEATVATVTTPSAFSHAVGTLDENTVYYYRYQASNAVSGTVWAESTQIFASKFSSVTSGLALWLKAETLELASGSPVKDWQDLSGSGQDAVQLRPNSQPQLVTGVRNGESVVRFDGSNDYLDGPTANLTAHTVYMVLKLEPTAVNLSGVFAQKGADNRNIRGSTTRWNSPEWQINSADFCYNGSVNVNGSATSYHNNEYHVLQEVAAGALSFQYRLSQTQYSRYFKGDLAEVIIYNRALSSAEQKEVTGYLATKYDINVAVAAHTLPAVADDPVLWVDADAIGGLSDGDTVNTWYDVTGNGYDFVKGSSGNPVYKVDQVHGRPVVRFDGDVNTYFTFSRISDIRTVFWVLREDADATGQRFLLGDGDLGTDEYHFHRGAGGEMWHATHASPFVRDGVTRVNGSPVNGTTTPPPITYSAVSLVTTGDVQANRFVKDRNAGLPSRSWKGDLAELLIYNRALSDSEERAVGAYLQDKYNFQPTVFVFK